MLKWLTLRIQHLSWPISRKFWLSIGLILTLFVLNGSLIFGIQMQVATLDGQEYHKARLVEELQDLRRLLKAQTDLFADAIFISGQKNFSNNLGGDISAILVDLRTRQAELGPEGLPLFQSLTDSYREVLTNLGQLREVLSQDVIKARQQWPTYAALFQATSRDLDNLYNQQFQTRQRLSRDKTNLIWLSLGVIGLSAVVSLLFGVLLALLFSRCVGRPIEQMQVYLDKVAAGDLSGQVRVENRDELGRLSLVLNLAIANLRQVLQGARVSEELKQLAQNLNSSSYQQASGSNEQLGSVNQIIHTMQELTCRSEQISAHAVGVAQASESASHRSAELTTVANQAGVMAVQVREVVNHTIENVADVSNTVVKLTGRLAQLSQEVQQIGKVINIISGVADEVHLLALNAAIEAAGAGEHGARFRVVAGEIRNLANRTKENAGQITGLILQVQQATQQARQEAETSSSRALDVVEANQELEIVVAGMHQIVQVTVEVASKIFEATRQVDKQVDEIKIATQEQMNASLQVNSALMTIGKMAQENVTVSHQIANSTTNLDHISARLVTMLADVSLN